MWPTRPAITQAVNRRHGKPIVPIGPLFAASAAAAARTRTRARQSNLRTVPVRRDVAPVIVFRVEVAGQRAFACVDSPFSQFEDISELTFCV